jgi:hypothetical protein
MHLRLMIISAHNLHLAGHVWLINHCRCISCSFHICPDIFPSTCTHIKHSTYASADIRSANANICINGRNTHVSTLFGWGAFNHKSVELRYRFAEVTFDLLSLKELQAIWISNLFIMSVPDEVYFRNTTCTLSTYLYIYMFLLYHQSGPGWLNELGSWIT